MAEGVDIKSHLKCGICLSIYTEPRVLSCYHAFCTLCLETLTSGSNQPECPLCCRKIVLTEEGVKGFKLYPFTDSPGNTDDEVLNICELCCDEKRAISRCTECSVNLCFGCHEYHAKLKSSRNHHIERVTTPEVKSESKEVKVKICDVHKNTLELFCYPCNKIICSDCLGYAHKNHKMESLRVSAMVDMKRNGILAKNASLKCRIHIIENAIDKTKIEELNYAGMTTQVKKEMKSYSNGLKEVLCKTIDSFINQQEEIIEDTKTTDLNKIHKYQDELKKEKMLLSKFTETADQMMKTYIDETHLQELFKLDDRLDHHLEKRGTNMPAVNVIQFEYGRWNNQIMQELLGRVLLHADTGRIKPSYDHLPQKVSRTTPSKISGFKSPDQILGIVSTNDDTAWVFTAKSIKLYNSAGNVRQTYTLPASSKKMLRKSGNEIWMWCGNHAVRIDTGLKQYNVEFTNAKAGCFIHSGNLVVYNIEDKHLYEVSDSGAVKKLHTSEELQQKLRNADIMMTETKAFNLLIKQEGSHCLIVDKRGTIINIFEYSEVAPQVITTDNYGNIVLAGYANTSGYYIGLLSEDGVFNRTLLRNENSSADHDVYYIKYMTIDGCGNLWFSNYHDNIVIYSYI